MLAGGQSTRMRSDKAMLLYQEKTLLEHAVETLRRVTQEVAVLGSPERYARFGVPVIEDEFPQCGPLGGIHAALATSTAELNLVIPVDTPLVTAEFLHYLLQRAARNSNAIAVVPEADGGVQATCAVYRRPFRSWAERHLKEGNNKIGAVLAVVAVEYVTEEEIRFAGFDPAMFANLNTPEEFSKAVARKQG